MVEDEGKITFWWKIYSGALCENVLLRTASALHKRSFVSSKSRFAVGHFLFAELKQLQQEFGNLHFDGENNSISVETDPIELDGLYLGPFRIEPHLNKLRELYGTSPYCVVALDPHPAATDQTVTNPHVSNERLC